MYRTQIRTLVWRVVLSDDLFSLSRTDTWTALVRQDLIRRMDPENQYVLSDQAIDISDRP